MDDFKLEEFTTVFKITNQCLQELVKVVTKSIETQNRLIKNCEENTEILRKHDELIKNYGLAIQELEIEQGARELIESENSKVIHFKKVSRKSQ